MHSDPHFPWLWPSFSHHNYRTHLSWAGKSTSCSCQALASMLTLLSKSQQIPVLILIFLLPVLGFLLTLHLLSKRYTSLTHIWETTRSSILKTFQCRKSCYSFASWLWRLITKREQNVSIPKSSPKQPLKLNRVRAAIVENQPDQSESRIQNMRLQHYRNEFRLSQMLLPQSP